VPEEYDLNLAQLYSVVDALSRLLGVVDPLARSAEDSTEWAIKEAVDREECEGLIARLFGTRKLSETRMTNRQAKAAVAEVLKSCIAKLEK
jgi:hypothetical protein